MSCCIAMRIILALALSMLVVTGVGVSGAFAQVVSATALVTVSTDMDSYSEGDTISITGSVLQRHTGAISVIVISPSDDIVNIGQPIVGVGNTFQMDIMTDSFMTESGTYTVEAHYSLDQRLPRMASTTFMYTAIGGSGVMVDGTDIEPNFTIMGGAVTEMYTNPSANTLTIMLFANSDGKFTIDLDRMLIDSQLADGTDDSFFVLVDGEEVEYEETNTTDDYRTISVYFPAGAESIEIIGTSVAVPEFGVVAALILAVAIVSIVVVSTRSQLFARI